MRPDGRVAGKRAGGERPERTWGRPRRAERLGARRIMKRTRWMSACLAGLGLTIVGLVGCQTQIPGTGQTLPTGRYLDHPPEYHPPSPPFPLSRELANQEKAAAGDAGGFGGANPLPPPVPVPGPGDGALPPP